MKKSLLILVGLLALFAALSAKAGRDSRIVYDVRNESPNGELRSGSAIVVFYSKQRVVFAGESRATVTGKTDRYSDDECKVSAPDGRFLFAASGMIAHDYRPGQISWSAQESASRIAARVTKGAADDTIVFAKEWGEWMRGMLDIELDKNEALLLSHIHNSLITAAIFAGRNKTGELSLYTVNFWVNETHERAIPELQKWSPTADGLPFAMQGEGSEVFTELKSGKTERAKRERSIWSASLPQDNSLAHDGGVTIRTLAFVIQHAGLSEIGGPIDAVALGSDGKIQWIQRKPNCKAGMSE